MKQIIFIAFCAILFSACGKDEKPDVVTEKIAELKAQFAPDKRVSIFNIEVQSKANPIILKGETQYPEAKETLKTFLDTSGITFLDSIVLLPDPDLGGTHFGVVRLPVCNIRTTPKHTAELSTQATLGTPLRIWKKLGDWYYIQTPDRYLGWLDGAGLTPMQVEQYRQWIGRQKRIVTARHSFVYAKADARSSIVTNAIAGNILAQTGGVENGYQMVGLPDGRQGFIRLHDTDIFGDWLESRTFTDSAILVTANRFMGVPYLWGGTSPNGFDCSGFTKTVFFLNGLVLPRDASQQVNVGVDLGTELDFGKWLPGDLLFFGRSKNEESPEKITHVAIYLGNGKIIHSAGNVKIESLKRTDPDFAPHRYDSFVRAKRMLGVSGDNGVYALTTMPEYTGE
jgi:hypothetical protein